ncbi:MAG: DUF3990 domain-containing protein [Lachnospiraceae bacterium]|nr:DUF3990 domain-containing protein [Lachnospiraceae bacterium]
MAEVNAATNQIYPFLFEASPVIKCNEIITLYHGSKEGIHGPIAPISRERCDFGKGFYMGTDHSQPLTLICNFPKARLYKLSFDLSDLEILRIDVGLEWALFVAYHREKMEAEKRTQFYERIKSWGKDCDMVTVYIANDRMFVVLDRFFNGEITDLALIHSLSILKLGKQYVALTEKVCSKIIILDEQRLSQEQRMRLKKESESNRKKGIALAEEMCNIEEKGCFFDEIIKAGDDYAGIKS